MIESGKATAVAIVEDDHEMSSMLADFLAHSGYLVTQFENPKEFLEGFLPDAGFNVIVSDFNMPAMNGKELLQKVRAADPSIPFILVSANSHPTLERQIIDEGANGFLCKPFRLNDLKEQIERVVANARVTAASEDATQNVC